MRIRGTAPGAPPDASPAVEEDPARTELVERSDKAEGPQGVTLPRGPAEVARLARVEGVAEVAAGLAGGRLAPEEAVKRVIERILDRQVGPDAPAAIRDQVGAALRDALESDPVLAEKVRALAR
jgi:hypothetical protein